jgi:lipoprotein-anchoring transpeptidase ErfK/SrfK
VATEGALIIPVVDKEGRKIEPMVLVPLSAPPASFVPAAAATNSAPGPARTNPAPNSPVPAPPFHERLLIAQLALWRQAISAGPMDGLWGPQTRAALRAFQRKAGLPPTGDLDDATLARLPFDALLYTNVIVGATDLAPLQPLGKTWLAKSQQTRLEFETALEMVAEKSCSNPKLLRALNPQIDWNNFIAGTSVKVVNVESPAAERKAALVRIFLAERLLEAFDAETNLLAHFPCSIAARVEKRPAGEMLHVAVMAPNPNYTFDPEVFPESAEARELGRKLIIPPGPNNPVGTVWIGLDKPGYGIHGTPNPEQVGRTESHGCFRLANWNAEHLLKLVTIGTPVHVEP